MIIEVVGGIIVFTDEKKPVPGKKSVCKCC